jgi:hypothetical protein
MFTENNRPEDQYEAAEREFRALLQMASDEHKRRLDEVSRWFGEERRKMQEEIINPTGQQVYEPKEVVRLYFRKMEEVTTEMQETVAKIAADAKEKVRDISFHGRVDEIMKEINPDEWKKHFGNL